MGGLRQLWLSHGLKVAFRRWTSIDSKKCTYDDIARALLGKEGLVGQYSGVPDLTIGGYSRRR